MNARSFEEHGLLIYMLGRLESRHMLETVVRAARAEAEWRHHHPFASEQASWEAAISGGALRGLGHRFPWDARPVAVSACRYLRCSPEGLSSGWTIHVGHGDILVDVSPSS